MYPFLLFIKEKCDQKCESVFLRNVKEVMGYKVCLAVAFAVLTLAGLVIARNDLIVGSLGADSVLIYQ